MRSNSGWNILKNSLRVILEEMRGRRITVKTADIAMNRKSETFHTLCQIPAAFPPKWLAMVIRIKVRIIGAAIIGTMPIIA